MSTHWLWSAQSWWRPASLVDSSSYLPTPPTPWSWPYQPVQWRFLPPANLGQQGRGWHGHSLLSEVRPGAGNHLALRPDLHMAVGTPGRRHSFFPCNLKSNKSRLIILVQQAYHLDSTFRSNPVKVSLSSSFLLQKVKATRKNIPDFIIWNFSMPLPGDHWKWSGNYRLVRLLLVKNNDANLLGPTVIDLLSCLRLKTSWL